MNVMHARKALSIIFLSLFLSLSVIAQNVRGKSTIDIANVGHLIPHKEMLAAKIVANGATVEPRKGSGFFAVVTPATAGGGRDVSIFSNSVPFKAGTIITAAFHFPDGRQSWEFQSFYVDSQIGPGFGLTIFGISNFGALWGDEATVVITTFPADGVEILLEYFVIEPQAIVSISHDTIVIDRNSSGQSMSMPFGDYIVTVKQNGFCYSALVNLE